MPLVDVGLDRDYPLVVDAVDLAQATGDLEFGNSAQGNQALGGGDEQFAQDVGLLAVPLR